MNLLFQKELHLELLNSIEKLENNNNYPNIPLENKLIIGYFKSRSLERSGKFNQALGIIKEIKNFLHDTLNDQQKMILLIPEIYAQWRLKDLDQCQDLIEQGKKICQILQKSSWLALFYNIVGLVNWTADKLSIAHINFAKSLIFETETSNKLISIARINNNIGNTYLKEKNYEKAENYYCYALNIRQEIDDRPGLATSYNSFARLYEAQNKYKRSQKYHINCLNLWKSIGNQQFIAKSLRFLGKNYEVQGLKEEAIQYYKQSLQLFSDLNNEIDIELTNNFIELLEIK